LAALNKYAGALNQSQTPLAPRVSNPSDIRPISANLGDEIIEPRRAGRRRERVDKIVCQQALLLRAHLGALQARDRQSGVIKLPPQIIVGILGCRHE
jgi:hypothetical protein